MANEAEELLARLRNERLVDPGRLQELTDRVRAKPNKYRAEQIAESLKKRGDLTEWQVSRLLNDVATNGEEIVDLAGGPEVVDLEKGGGAPVDPFAVDPFATSSGSGAAGLDAFGGMDAGGAFAAEPAKPERKSRKKKVQKNQWESPLLLLGSGGLALLMLSAGFLLFVLWRGSATDMFAAAENAYRAQSYNQAVDLYERYLESFPNGDDASLARVRIGMSALRQKAESGRDMTEALKTAQEVLPVIKVEEAFDDEIRGELAVLLPEVAEGFSMQAVNAAKIPDAERFVALSDEAMKLVDDSEYIPRNQRETQAGRLAKIDENLKLARRSIEREKRLSEALAQINAFAGEGKIEQAYAVRRDLVRDYPGLATDDRLVEAIGVVVSKEQELVQVQPSSLVSVTTDVPQRDAAIFSTARVEGSPVADAPEGVYVAYGRQAAYGVELKTGRPVWRRFMGSGGERVPIEVGGDAVLLSDTEADAVTLVGRNDGVQRWRVPIGEAFEQPTVFGDVALVAAASGKLHSLGLADGAPRSMAQFSQPLSAAPGFDEQRPLLYQVGRQTNLYVLNADSLACREVYYLGQKAGSVAVPPAVMRGYIFVAENAGADYCLLHVLKSESSGLGLQKAQDPIRMDGHIHAPMKVYDRRLVVITDSGATAFYEVDPSAKTDPVVATTKFTATQREDARPWSLIYSGTLFVAERRLTRYEVQTARGQLNRSWIEFEGDVFTGPIVQAGTSAVTFPHRQAGLPSQTITAVDQASGDAVWRCDVGFGGLALFDPQATGASGPLLFSSLGQAFALPDWNAPAPFLQQTATAGVGARGSSFDQAFVRSDRAVVLYGKNNPDRAAVYQQGKDPIMRVVRFGVRGGRPTADSILWRDALIVPWSAGQLYALDPLSGTDLAAPFQPPLQPGQEVTWSRPAASPRDPTALFAAEKSGAVYRIVFSEGAKPFLKEGAAGKVEGEIVGPLAAIGGVVAVPVSSGADWRIELLSESTLKRAKEIPVETPIVAGPFAVGDAFVVLLASGDAIAIEESGEIRWEKNLPAETLARDPIAADGKLVLAYRSGDLVALDLATGGIDQATRWDEGFERLIAVRDGKVLAVSAEGAGVVLSLSPTDDAARTTAVSPAGEAVAGAAAE